MTRMNHMETYQSVVPFPDGMSSVLLVRGNQDLLCPLDPSQPGKGFVKDLSTVGAFSWGKRSKEAGKNFSA